MDYISRAKKFRAKKRLGQNFLIDEEVFDTIIESADIKEDEIVVEIGAGLGFLTEKLVQYAKKVYAIEIDKDAIKELKKIQAYNLEIVENDVLKTDFSQFGEKIKVVANIPYYITSPIIAHLLGEIDDEDNKNRKVIDEIILMTQYEVAKRLTAEPKSKEYGLLTILGQFRADISYVATVKAKSFMPAPKVNSAVIKFEVLDKPVLTTDNDYKFFSKVAKACFATRRKTIKNSLINAGFDKNIVSKALCDANINENERGENLSIDEIGALSKCLRVNRA